jgi:hypothetical protein
LAENNMNKSMLTIFVLLSLVLTRCILEPDRGYGDHGHGDGHEDHGDRDHRDR